MDIGIAVKRPRSRIRFQKIAKAAAKQVIKMGMQGIVAVDLGVVVNPEDNDLAAADTVSAQKVIAAQGRYLAERIAATIRVRYGIGNVFGVITRIIAPLWARRRRTIAIVSQWHVIAHVGNHDPRAQILDELSDRIRGAETAA